MPVFSVIKCVLCCGWNRWVLKLLRSGFTALASFVFFATCSHSAIAQFPGVGTEAKSGVATQAANYGSNPNAAKEESSESGEQMSVDASVTSGRMDDDNGGSEYQTPENGVSIRAPNKEQSRKQLFIKKLRIEFAAIEVVEQETGLPFSRDDVPRYLDLLLNELEMTAAKEEKGEVIDARVKSISRDAYYIETQLNHHIDQLLEHVGQDIQKKPLFAVMPALPKSIGVSRKKIDSLFLKFELASFGEKALQAMGAKRY